MFSTHRRIRGVALLGAVAGACVLAAPAVAGAHTYSVVLSPPSAAGGARVEFKATFTNRASDVKLGSADLTAPAGFSVVSASVPVGSATTAGDVVQLRNLFVAPGKSVTATVVADVPCTAGDATWSVVARKTGDFTGADSGPRVNSQLTTTVTGGGCATSLRFVNQPANARVNETITTSPYNAARRARHDRGRRRRRAPGDHLERGHHGRHRARQRHRNLARDDDRDRGQRPGHVLRPVD